MKKQEITLKQFSALTNLAKFVLDYNRIQKNGSSSQLSKHCANNTVFNDLEKEKVPRSVERTVIVWATENQQKSVDILEKYLNSKGISIK